MEIAAPIKYSIKYLGLARREQLGYKLPRTAKEIAGPIKYKDTPNYSSYTEFLGELGDTPNYSERVSREM